MHSLSIYIIDIDLEKIENYSDDAVVLDKNIITSRGPGTSMAFALKLVEVLYGDQKANQIMLKVHNEGEASCGIFTKDVAETKSFEVNNLAKINDHPLISIVKPNYD